MEDPMKSQALQHMVKISSEVKASASVASHTSCGWYTHLALYMYLEQVLKGYLLYV